MSVMLLVVHFAYLYGINHYTEDAEVVSAANIAAQSDAQAMIKELTDRCHAGCYVEI